MESRQRWIKRCISRILKLDIRYSRTDALELSKRDIWTIRGALILQSGLAFDLFHCRSARGLDRWLMFISEPEFYIADFVESNKLLRAEILHQLTYMPMDPAATCLFKGDCVPLGITSWGAVAPLADILREEYTVEKIALINQWTSFPARLCLRDVDFHDSAFDKYVADEEYVSSLTYPRDDPLVSMMTDVVTEWFKDYKTNWSLCGHGSGACAEAPRGTPAWAKNLLTVYDDRIWYLISHYDELLDILPPPNGDWNIRANVVQAVPKTTTKNRLVSKEPATLMFLQHAIERSLNEYIEADSVLSAHFHVRDQCVNRRQALRGSQDGSYATLDQSDASDMVAKQLVATITRKCRDLHRDLFCTRSSKAVLQYDKKTQYTIPLSKFAPMGSDTCFKVECIVFGAALEATVRLESGKPSRETDWSIYGDDATIRTKYVDAAMKNLESLGFRLNRDKSFYIDLDGPYNFRESCGAECLAGIDITPLRISRRFALSEPGFGSKAAKRDRPHCVDNLLTLANEAWAHGLLGVRAACLQVLDLLGIPIQSLEWVPCDTFPHMYEYYVCDGEAKYDWICPVPCNRDTLSPVSQLPGIRTFPNHFWGRWNTPRYCLTTTTVESRRMTKIYLGRIRHLPLFRYDSVTIDRACVDEWFTEARLREYGIAQDNAVAYSWSDWRTRGSRVERDLPLAIQREVAVPALFGRVRPAVMSWVW
jgi:hypothetical protein